MRGIQSYGTVLDIGAGILFVHGAEKLTTALIETSQLSRFRFQVFDPE